MNLARICCVIALVLCGAISRSAAQEMRLPTGAALPKWAVPAVVLPPGAPSVRSGKLRLAHSDKDDIVGGFIVYVDGQPTAIGQNLGFIGYVQNGGLRWLDLARVAKKKFVLRARWNGLRTRLTFLDDDGAQWEIQQEFRAAPMADAIEVKTEIKVDQNRAVAFLPLLTLFPG